MGPRKQPKYHQTAGRPPVGDPPENHRKSCKNDTKIHIIPTYVKSCFLQYLPHQMLGSGAPDIQIQTLKSLKNVTCKHACQKTQLLCQSWPKTSIEIQAWTPKVSFRVLPSPPASLDGPLGAKLGATNMPNDTFWAPNLTTSAPQFTVN